MTVLVLAASARCHNFAGTRAALWDRRETWAAAVADDTGAGAPSAA